MILLSVSIFFVGIFLAFYPNFDPDFWWHLRTGQEILESGQIPRTDTYSFTMPDYQYIYHSWLAEVYLATFYSWGGHTAVVISLASLISGAVLLLTFTKKIKFTVTIIGLTLIPVIVQTTGLRTQVFSYFGLALTLWLTTKIKVKPNLGLLSIITIIFIIWTNTHPGFVVGYLLYLAIIASQTYANRDQLANSKQFKVWLLALIITPLLATLLNPYGFTLHQFIWQMSQNPTAMSHNADWVGYLSNPVIQDSLKLQVITWTIVTIWLSRGQHKVVIALLSLMTIYSTRYALPLIAYLTFCLPHVFQEFVSRFRLASSQINRIKYLTFGLLLLISWRHLPQFEFAQAAHQNHQAHAFASRGMYNYPYQAVENLSELPGRNIFNHYNWGGYLIYHLPTKKVFIDGRMDNFHLDSGRSFMELYLTLINTDPGWQDLLVDYPIDYFLLMPGDPLAEAMIAAGGLVLFSDEISLVIARP